MTKKISKKLKEKIENKMLIILSISTFAYLSLLFIYRGYINTKYILAMSPVIYSLSIIFAGLFAAFIYYFFKFKENLELKNRFLKYSVVSIIALLSSLFIHRFNIHAVKVIATLLTIYLIGSLLYYLNYQSFVNSPKLKFRVLGVLFIISAVFVLIFSNLFGKIFESFWNIFFYKNTISLAFSKIIVNILSYIDFIIGIILCYIGFSNKKVGR